jgi:hypothetical protein
MTQATTLPTTTGFSEASKEKIRSLFRRVGSPEISSFVEIEAVYYAEDRIKVLCSDKRVRTCVLKTARDVLKVPGLTAQVIFDKLTSRIGTHVSFVAAEYNGTKWSPDVYFVAVIPMEEN